MDTRAWGAHAWTFLHAALFNYPVRPTEADRENMRTFINSFATVLPCPTCRHHFANLLRSMPFEECLGGRESLARWGVAAHNIVNRRLGKREYAYDEVAPLYEQIRGSTCEASSDLPDARCSKKHVELVRCNQSSDKTKATTGALVVLALIVAIMAYNAGKRNGARKQ